MRKCDGTAGKQFEIINKDGSGTGVYKDRNAVHRDGDLHASSRVWIARDDMDRSGFSVLLQQRSPDKDAFPNCFNTSCAGHVARGDTYEATVIRELEEELGIKSGDRLNQGANKSAVTIWALLNTIFMVARNLEESDEQPGCS